MNWADYAKSWRTAIEMSWSINGGMARQRMGKGLPLLLQKDAKLKMRSELNEKSAASGP
jgi:hypothetical protein